MPFSIMKLYLDDEVSLGGGYAFVARAPGNLSFATGTSKYHNWLAAIPDLDGDGVSDFIVGAASDDDKYTDAGRIWVTVGAPTIGSAAQFGVGAAGASIVIDAPDPGNLAGVAVGFTSDMNGDSLSEILVGSPGYIDPAGTATGAAFVLWGISGDGGIDLGEPAVGDGKGFAIFGEATGDQAGAGIISIGDLNGDGITDVLVGAHGNDAGGADAGAAYVVFGTSSEDQIFLSDIATGSGGFRITGAASGDAIGVALAAVGDQNGDALPDFLIGSTNSNTAYVVFGKSSGTEINLATLTADGFGYAISGVLGDGAGATVASAGDVNNDGIEDFLIAAPDSGRVYVVFGQGMNATDIDLAQVRNGVGGFEIFAEALGDFSSVSLAGGKDLNGDGIDDIVIGAAGNDEGGLDAGAVYVVWGGGTSDVDLSSISASMGGAKIVGSSGSLTGQAIAFAGDANGDGREDLLIGAPGVGESVYVLFNPTSWMPDYNVYGSSGDDVMSLGYGGLHQISDLSDTIFGLGGNDSISGNGGDDIIDGGTGVDLMIGGLGDDTYYVDNALDTVTEQLNEGNDTVIASVNYTISANVENLTLAGNALSGSGNDENNTITGNAYSNVIDGGSGADTMSGGTGNDTYVVDDRGDIVIEDAGQGIDGVISSIDYTLPDNIEALTLVGNARRGTGNALANSLYGTDFSDTLDGGTGADTLSGGLGDDTYYVDNASDAIVEATSAGNDTVFTSVDYVLSSNVENLFLSGAARSGTGNTLNNNIEGTAGNDTLDGGLGADTLTGGTGDDTYYVDNAGDVVVELAGEGIDVVVAAIDYTLAEGSIENLTLIGSARLASGNALDNTIIGTSYSDTLFGNGGDDIMDGGAGADQMVGGTGDDTYYVDNALDTATEDVNGGSDTVIASVDYVIGANIENLTLAGSAVSGIGNGGDNTVTGNASANILDGGNGADTMIGGAGDDVYYIDDPNDVIIELVGGGNDTIIVSTELAALPDNVENIILSGDVTRAVGNSGNNAISGTANDDYLDGGDGDDHLIGGDGNDHLYANSGHDILSGGSGDDVYHISGAEVEVEDYLGHDTLDCSESTSDDYVDLSGDTQSIVGDCPVNIPPGGTTASPLDVQFLQDLSGSFADDITTVRTLVPNLVAALQAVQVDSLFGLSSFIDKPVAPFGATGEWVYRQELGLTNSTSALSSAYGSIWTRSGADGSEAQIEALMQLALHASDVGFRAESARFVVLFTDAPFHIAGDGASGGITTPNNGDAFYPSDGALEDYPEIAQVKSALEAANIIPIFAVAGGYETTYTNLATALGRGQVVTLSANSSNIADAITAGMVLATTTTIEDLTAGSGNDTLIGGAVANLIDGGDGDDTIDGREGDDDLRGGAGNDHFLDGLGNDTYEGGDGTDQLVYAGALADYTVSTINGVTKVFDGTETDTITNVEFVIFSDQTIHLNSKPTGNVIVTGIALQGNTLTVDISEIADVDGIDGTTISYQWLRDGVAIGGEVKPTHVLTQADVGTTISVKLIYRDLYGTEETVTSGSTFVVQDVNDSPTALSLSASSLDENNTAGAVIATLSATDPDGADSGFAGPFTYELVAGDGDTGNAAFTVVGNELQINGVADFEAQSSYSIRLKVTDNAGLSYETSQTITVTDVNEDPGFSIVELSRSGDVVTYGLVADGSHDPGSDGIGSFAFTLDYDPAVATLDGGSFGFASGLQGIAAGHDTVNGTIQIDGLASEGQPTFSDFTVPLVQFQMTIADNSQPVSLTVTDTYFDNVAIPDSSGAFDYSTVQVTTNVTTRSGVVMEGVNINNFAADQSGNLFLRAVSLDGGEVQFELVARPGTDTGAFDFKITQNGLSSFQLGASLDGWTVQINDTTPGQIVVSGIAAIDGNLDLAAGSETVLATFTTPANVEMTVSDAVLGTQVQSTITVSDNWISTDTSGQSVHTLTNGAEIYISANNSFENVSPTRVITAQDALEALRISVGLDPTTGPADQFVFVAADFNRSGRVSSQDAFDILRYSVGLDNTYAGEWVFLDDGGDWSGLNRTSVTYHEGVTLDALGTPATANLTGVLIGDVDDSFSSLLLA